MSSKPKTSKVVDFTDESIRDDYTDRPDRYRAQKGRRDIIRIVTLPKSFYGANVRYANNEDKGFWANSLADHDDIANDDLAACKKQCPLFKRGYDIKQRFCVLVHWISSVDRKGRAKPVNQVMPWVFDASKFAAIRNIISTLPPNKKTGKPMDIRRIALSVDCEDNTFQKMSFAAITTREQMGATWSDTWELASEHFEDAENPNSECELVEETIRPDTLQKLIKSLERAEGESSKGDEYDDEEVDDDSDDEELDDFDDEEDIDEDDDDEPAPKQRTRRSKKRPTKSTKKKTRTTKPKRRRTVDDEEEEKSLEEELEDSLDDDTPF